MEYLNCLKLVEKDLSTEKPKMVTRLLRNRVVLKEVDAETKPDIYVPVVSNELSPDAGKEKDSAEQKILCLALANNIAMDTMMKKVMAFSPVVKVERKTLFPSHSRRTSMQRLEMEMIETSTEEDLTKLTDRDNTVEKKPCVDALSKENVLPLEPGKVEKSGNSVSNFGHESKIIYSLEEKEIQTVRKIKESSPYIELSAERDLQYNDSCQELIKESIDVVEENKELFNSIGDSKESITENVLSVKSHVERSYCDFCNIGYTSDTVLQKHKQNCKMNPLNKKTFPGKIFYCRYCYFGITNENYFKLHESKCNNEQQNNKPKKRLKRNKQLVGSKTKRSKLEQNKCPHCDYTSKNVGHLNEHILIHSKVPLCICEICDKGFNRISSLRMHMFKHLNLAEEISLVESKDICDENAKKITMQVKLNGRNIEIVKYECNICEFVTTVLFSLEMHINTMHLKKQKFKCNVCPFTCYIKSNLRQHLNLHTKERTYKCKKCSYECLNLTYLKKHDNQIHTKEKVFECNSCDFKCYRHENLKCHINSMHSKKKRYDCKFCKYFSYYQSNLINHVKAIHIT